MYRFWFKLTLTIVGKNPPKDFVHMAEDPKSRVRVTGFVEDLDPYFAKSTLMVIHVRAGGGMRVRILEAFVRNAGGYDYCWVGGNTCPAGN